MSATATQLFVEGHRLDQGLAPLLRGANTYDSAYFSMRDYHKVAIIVSIGAVTATGTLAVSVLQAKDDAGSAAKAITGKSVSIVDGDDSKLAVIEIDASELDVNGKFDHILVRSIIANDNVTHGITVVRHQPRYSPVGTSQLAEVAS